MPLVLKDGDLLIGREVRPASAGRAMGQSGEDGVGIMRPLRIGIGGALVIFLALVGIRSARRRAFRKFEEGSLATNGWRSIGEPATRSMCKPTRKAHRDAT
jgi:hypothetical protein